MALDVQATRALTGRWAGHYEQRDQRRDVTAELRQQGTLLQGTMHDSQTRFEMSVYEMAAECGLAPGADEQIVKALREQYPDRPTAPIRALMTLPERSEVEGEVRGSTVSFRKVYRGEAFSGYTVGDARVGVTVRGHSVQYLGHLDADGGQIDGTWWIEADPRKGVTRRTEGMFVLRRLAE
jgi:hypothetical protein